MNTPFAAFLTMTLDYRQYVQHVPDFQQADPLVPVMPGFYRNVTNTVPEALVVDAGAVPGDTLLMAYRDHHGQPQMRSLTRYGKRLRATPYGGLTPSEEKRAVFRMNRFVLEIITQAIDNS